MQNRPHLSQSPLPGCGFGVWQKPDMSQTIQIGQRDIFNIPTAATGPVPPEHMGRGAM